MIAFHVSDNLYAKDELIKGNNYLDITSRRGNVWVETLLERHRPKESPNRKYCVFTFENLEALGYYSDLLISSNLKFYEVELLSTPCRCPMHLCGFIQSKRNEKQDYLDRLAIEYWTNSLKWNFIELLNSSFKIIRQINKPSIEKKVLGLGMYAKDKRIASGIK